jgi:hypothetical protein
MDTISQRKKYESKYGDLTEEERKNKYKAHSREWYANKTEEEKKEINKRSIERKKSKFIYCYHI